MNKAACTALDTTRETPLTQAAAFDAGSLGGFVHAMIRLPIALFEILLTWQERASERRRLAQMDDRLLSDMGLSRADVERETSIPFWRNSQTEHRPLKDRPVYRLEFDNGQGTIAQVSPVDGRVALTDRRIQTWRLLTSVHEFAPLSMWLGSGAAARNILILTAALSLVVVVTGYCMQFFPRPRRGIKRAPNI